MKKIRIPENTKKVLLHCCCAPCSSAIVEWMLNNHIKPTLYFSNPNIFPDEEYGKRKSECIRYAESVGIDFVDADYDHKNWLELVKGLEKEPERGRRCLECFRIRLKMTAEYAHKNGFHVITTTLASSRWKDMEQITEAGEYAVREYDDVVFWNQNWKKSGLSERRSLLSREYGFYNQQYCGCEFSIRK